MNSPDRWRRLASIVSTFDGGWAAQCTPAEDDHGEHEDDHARDDIRPPSFGLVDDIGRRRVRELSQRRLAAGRRRRRTRARSRAAARPTVRRARARRAGPAATIACTSSSLPWSATFSRTEGGRDVVLSPLVWSWRHGMLMPLDGDCAGRVAASAASTVGGPERHRSQPRAGRVEDRIRDRRGHDRRRRLARTPRNFVRPVDQVDRRPRARWETSGSDSFPS